MKSRVVTVTDTATLVFNGTINSADDYITKTLYLKPSGSDVHLGDATVTTANGFPLANNDVMTIALNPGQSLHAIVSSGSHSLIVLEDS